MKAKSSLVVKGLIIALLSVFLTNSYAQKGRGMQQNCPNRGEFMMCENIPDLTESQKTQIATIRTNHLKKITEYENRTALKRIELNDLQAYDNADLNAINAKIDEIGDIMTATFKEKAAMHQEVRNTLSEDQKVYFDAFHSRHRPGPGHGGF